MQVTEGIFCVESLKKLSNSCCTENRKFEVSGVQITTFKRAWFEILPQRNLHLWFSKSKGSEAKKFLKTDFKNFYTENLKKKQASGVYNCLRKSKSNFPNVSDKVKEWARWE